MLKSFAVLLSALAVGIGAALTLTASHTGTVHTGTVSHRASHVVGSVPSARAQQASLVPLDSPDAGAPSAAAPLVFNDTSAPIVAPQVTALPFAAEAPDLPRLRPEPRPETQPEALPAPAGQAAPTDQAVIAFVPAAPRLSISTQDAGVPLNAGPLSPWAAPSTHMPGAQIPTTPGAINFNPWNTGVYR